MTRRRPSLPLAVWLALGAVATVVGVVGSVALVLSRDGLTATETLALAVGLTLGTVIVVLRVLWATKVTAGLQALHAEAVRRLRDPSLRADAGRPEILSASTELADLARVLDALHLRARVADELAEQSRRTAEHTSAGVFELLSGLVAAEEATRGQLSAELHDTVAQSLAVARSLLSRGRPVGAGGGPDRPGPQPGRGG